MSSPSSTARRSRSPRRPRIRRSRISGISIGKTSEKLGQDLEQIYARYNRREYVHPDPLEFLYDYPDIRDREIAGLIAASLAYGRVAQILKSVAAVLEPISPSPFAFLKDANPAEIQRRYAGFVHRFAKDAHLAALLIGTKGVIAEYGSLYEGFTAGTENYEDTVVPALDRFARRILAHAPANPGHLLPLASRGSACKRMNLFLRWMVRKDAVDPGGWDAISPAKLIVPLDVHMHRVSRELGLTTRKAANMRTAIEITRGFARFSPDDPVKYDFALTRPGIWGEKPEKM